MMMHFLDEIDAALERKLGGIPARASERTRRLAACTTAANSI